MCSEDLSLITMRGALRRRKDSIGGVVRRKSVQEQDETEARAETEAETEAGAGAKA